MRYLVAGVLALACAGCRPPEPTAALASALRHAADQRGPACFTSAVGRFFFGSDVEQVPGPSWLVLSAYGVDRTPARTDGAAFLYDHHGPAAPTAARWQRLGGDSVLVSWMDSFGRWEARLSPTPLSITGMARFQTDEVERDTDGVWRPTIHRWAVWARRIPCDSVPLSPSAAA